MITNNDNQFSVEGVRCSVIVQTKYGATLHVEGTDRIHFSTPVLSNQITEIKNTRPLSKNGMVRNQTR